MSIQYTDLTTQIASVKSHTRLSMILAASINIVVLIGLFYINSNDQGQSNLNAIDTCMAGANAIIQKELNTKLLSNSIIKDLKSGQNEINFSRIHLIKQTGELNCDIILKDQKGFQLFDFALSPTSSGHKIIDISGKRITQRYQR